MAQDARILTRDKWKTRETLGLRYAVFNCPDCGHVIDTSGLAIDAKGLVIPDVACPYYACRFEGPIQLEGWTG